MTTFHRTPATVFENGQHNEATGDFPHGIICIPARDGTPTHLTIRDARIVGASVGDRQRYALPGILAYGGCTVTIGPNVEIVGGDGAETTISDRFVLNSTDSFSCEGVKIIGGTLRIEGGNITIRAGVGGQALHELIGNNIVSLPIRGAAGIVAAQMKAIYVGPDVSIRGGKGPEGFADGRATRFESTDAQVINDMRVSSCRPRSTMVQPTT